MGFKISRMSKGDWGNTKAYFDIQDSDGFVIKGFRLMNSENGMFVSFPSQKQQDGQFKDTIYADKGLRADVYKIAIDYYENPEGHNSDNTLKPPPFSPQP